MPPIETIARPRSGRISVRVPKEYRSHSFQVILVPLGGLAADVPPRPRKSRTFVDALLSCPKLDEGETLDLSRDETDSGREIAL